MDNHLVIFARAPHLGTVKRRLAGDLGPVAAARFHRLATGSLIRRLGGDRRWRTWLAVTPDAALRQPDALWANARRAGAVGVFGQGPGDLGERMARAFAALPPGPVVIVGTDIPDIGRPNVAAAFRALGRAEAVIGPAGDGGYWLIGLRRRPSLRPPFAGVRWGGAHALADTLANLDGRAVALLEERHDVDRAEDLMPGGLAAVGRVVRRRSPVAGRSAAA